MEPQSLVLSAQRQDQKSLVIEKTGLCFAQIFGPGGSYSEQIIISVAQAENHRGTSLLMQYQFNFAGFQLLNIS